MSVIPSNFTRVSTMLQSTVMANSIDQTQLQLLETQNELTTGKAVNEPSDNPSAASTIIQLNQSLARGTTYSNNINTASAQLSQVDSNLGSLNTLLTQAEQIASSDVGTNITQSQRTADASVVQSIYNQALAMANQQFNGQYLFGGATGNTQPFSEVNGSVQFNGSPDTLTNTYDDGISLAFQVNGAQVFGSLSSGVTGTANITPDLTAQTRISDAGGAIGDGIHLTSIQLSNGAVSKTVDLSSADTFGDVVSLINAAGVGGITASLTGQGITLSGAVGDNISVTDLGGTTAADLGIATAAGGEGAGNPDVGSTVNPRITALTPISELNGGTGLDNSGLVITNGNVTKTITWASGGNVQDILNAINGSGVGVTAQINGAGTGLNIMNATQGVNLSIGENGGATATQLGLNTLNAATTLASLNNNQGLPTAGGTTPDFQITAANGTTYQVALGSDATIQDVLNSINTATGGAVTAAMSTTGNAIVLTDTTTGSTPFGIKPLNDSTAAAQLGLMNAPSGNTITATGAGAVQSTGLFGNLQALIANLQSGDTSGITTAATGIQTDMNRVTELRGQTGATEQELQNRQTQLTQESTAATALVSQLQDTDMAKTITQFTTLQTALQASLQTAASSLQLSLLNYIST